MRRRRLSVAVLLCLVALLWIGACERRRGEPAAQPAEPVAKGGVAAADSQERVPVVAFLGDSLTAGLGLDLEEAYPALVEERLVGRGCAMRAVNAGVSGDTSAGGVSRIDWVLSARPRVVVLELGANDGLRGQSLASTETNLRLIARHALDAGASVILAGMRLPPSMGPRYADAFAAIYPRVAKDLGLELVPFLLEGVAGRPELNQADGIHPTAAGQRAIALTVAPHVERVLGCTTPPR